jgi:hypothetical protein
MLIPFCNFLEVSRFAILQYKYRLWANFEVTAKYSTESAGDLAVTDDYIRILLLCMVITWKISYY